MMDRRKGRSRIRKKEGKEWDERKKEQKKKKKKREKKRRKIKNKLVLSGEIFLSIHYVVFSEKELEW